MAVEKRLAVIFFFLIRLSERKKELLVMRTFERIKKLIWYLPSMGVFEVKVD